MTQEEKISQLENQVEELSIDMERLDRTMKDYARLINLLMVKNDLTHDVSFNHRS